VSPTLTDMRDFFQRLLKGRYTNMLEEEVARERAENERVRAENRALINSLLGTAGFPPVEFPAAPEPQSLPRLRKRSWHQVQAWREAEASRESSGIFGATGDGEPAHGEPMDYHVRTNGPVPHS
jgi:hypothetical protein